MKIKKEREWVKEREWEREEANKTLSSNPSLLNNSMHNNIIQKKGKNWVCLYFALNIWPDICENIYLEMKPFWEISKKIFIRFHQKNWFLLTQSHYYFGICTREAKSHEWYYPKNYKSSRKISISSPYIDGSRAVVV